MRLAPWNHPLPRGIPSVILPWSPTSPDRSICPGCFIWSHEKNKPSEEDLRSLDGQEGQLTASAGWRCSMASTLATVGEPGE